MDSSISNENSNIVENYLSDGNQSDKVEKSLGINSSRTGQSVDRIKTQDNNLKNALQSVSYPAKRKLESEDEQNEASDNDSNKGPQNRSRGKYVLRKLPRKDLSESTDIKTKGNKKKRNENKSVGEAGHTSQFIDETIPSAGDSKEIQGKDKPLPENQIAHNDEILKILNEGSLPELKALPRVGPKTAMILFKYRSLHGKLQSISDLAKMSGLPSNFLQLFLSANQIIH